MYHAKHANRNVFPHSLKNYKDVVDHWFSRAGWGPGSVSKDILKNTLDSGAMKEKTCVLMQILQQKVFTSAQSLHWLTPRRCDCAAGRVYGAMLYMQHLAERHNVSNADFVLCVGDGSYEIENTHSAPFFLPATRFDGKLGIPFPIRERNFHDSFMLDLWPKMVKGYSDTSPDWKSSWGGRSAKAFFRGNMRNGKRPALAALAKKNPQLFDVGGAFVSTGSWNTRSQEYKPNPSYESWKYQIIIGGNGGWADRIMEQSFRHTVQLIVDEGTYDFWWPRLKPFEHYIFIDQNMTSLVTCIQELQRNDGIAASIMEKQIQAAEDMLTPAAIDEYSMLALNHMATLLDYTPTRFDDALSPEEFMSFSKSHGIRHKTRKKKAGQEIELSASEWMLMEDVWDCNESNE